MVTCQLLLLHYLLVPYPYGSERCMSYYIVASLCWGFLHYLCGLKDCFITNE